MNTPPGLFETWADVKSTGALSQALMAPNPSTSTLPFPFTGATPPVIGAGNWNTVEHCVGTMLVFDASQTRNPTPPDDLMLESSVSFGRAGRIDPITVASTVARDVSVAFEAVEGAQSVLHRIAIVGSTNDDQLFATLSPAPAAVLDAYGGGGSDGFLLTAVDRLLQPDPFFMAGTYQGDSRGGGWTGVHSWNGFRDHLAVSGWVDVQPFLRDIEIASFVVDTATAAGNAPSQLLRELRRTTIATPADETPVAMGAFLATAPVGPAVVDWAAYDLGSPAGGGIAMDERGRLNVVGSTDPGSGTTSAWPVQGQFSRNYLNGVDACRIVASMLPPAVGRTDLSGEQVHAMGVIPAAPAGRTGATTPTCALEPFGWQLDGGGQPALQRMLVDWEGPAPAPSPVDPNTQRPIPVHFLYVDRPPVNWQFAAAFVHLGVPIAPPAAPAPLPLGIENWLSNPQQTSLLFSIGVQSARIPLVLPPGSGVTFSAQVVAATLAPFACTNEIVAASPAIVFSY